jgi:hypothetical protein
MVKMFIILNYGIKSLSFIFKKWKNKSLIL